MRCYTAKDIAKWFIAWAEAQDAEITNLKLQKLLYYAQGHYVGDHGRRLFTDDLYAWQHGPVVKDVYHAFKHNGRVPIEPDEALSNFSWDDYRDVEPFLIDIWDRYAVYSAWVLRNKTHGESPWKDTEPNHVIDEVKLKEFFTAPGNELRR